MKAIRIHEFGPPEVMRLEEVPDPVVGLGQVVVQVMASGVNPLETYLRDGIKIGDYSPALPYTPGTEVAGMVWAVGENVQRHKVGDRVYGSPLSGAHAQFALCNEQQVYPLPDNITFPQGSAINVPYRTAYYALFHLAGLKAGETVLVHGASGSVGIAAVQMACAAGAIVVGTASSETRLKSVREHGAHHALNHRQPDYLSELKTLTAGRGVDVILEMAANVNLPNDIKALRMGGRVVLIGGQGNAIIDPVDIIGRGVHIIGLSLQTATPEINTGIAAALREGLESGDLRPVIGEEIPLSEIARAHHLVEGAGATGRIALIPPHEAV